MRVVEVRSDEGDEGGGKVRSDEGGGVMRVVGR